MEGVEIESWVVSECVSSCNSGHELYDWYSWFGLVLGQVSMKWRRVWDPNSDGEDSVSGKVLGLSCCFAKGSIGVSKERLSCSLSTNVL